MELQQPSHLVQQLGDLTIETTPISFTAITAILAHPFKYLLDAGFWLTPKCERMDSGANVLVGMMVSGVEMTLAECRRFAVQTYNERGVLPAAFVADEKRTTLTFSSSIDPNGEILLHELIAVGEPISLAPRVRVARRFTDKTALLEALLHLMQDNATWSRET